MHMARNRRCCLLPMNCELSSRKTITTVDIFCSWQNKNDSANPNNWPSRSAGIAEQVVRGSKQRKSLFEHSMWKLQIVKVAFFRHRKASCPMLQSELTLYLNEASIRRKVIQAYFTASRRTRCAPLQRATSGWCRLLTFCCGLFRNVVASGEMLNNSARLEDRDLCTSSSPFRETANSTTTAGCIFIICVIIDDDR